MAIGPFFFAPMVLAAIAGVITLLAGCAILTRRVSPQFDHWPWLTMLMVLASARLGFVIRHWESFFTEPWRIFYFWQGGFDIAWAIAAAVVSLVLLQGWRLRALGGVLLGLVAAVMAALALLVPGPLAQPMPAVALPDMGGQLHPLQRSGEQKVVINLWATWCGPCRREMPMLEQAARQNPDVRFLFVNQGESAARIERYLQQEGLDLKQWIRLDPDSTLSAQFRTRGLPTTLFFNDNTLQRTHVGEISREVLSEKLNGL
ncbi:TlpA disulfide reductase family protein [Advenella mimigardefordensis]|uniref:Putative thioredoxin-like protein n=1 Tax=Advenella mimigardefordensis (strain DSM 17166 / LMG 22922 / DPN7) TaxID=1247726 RepID=W0PA67_ADVMD|nr:TlpA disulfide reductase family protein [Advenella mimigardefordensis]AHG62387.1 putative thioredoxin-like protein [Advenella mimigardefordensis DPN7]